MHRLLPVNNVTKLLIFSDIYCIVKAPAEFISIFILFYSFIHLSFLIYFILFFIFLFIFLFFLFLFLFLFLFYFILFFFRGGAFTNVHSIFNEQPNFATCTMIRPLWITVTRGLGIHFFLAIPFAACILNFFLIQWPIMLEIHLHHFSHFLTKRLSAATVNYGVYFRILAMFF